MSKGLEALERIKRSHFVATTMLGIKKRDIETENAIATIEKELKALEIIRKYNIDIYPIKLLENKKDYDLLKEVLSYDK